MKEVVMVAGYPAAGKTTVAAEFPKHTRFNRDLMGKTLADLAAKLYPELHKPHDGFILDNTFATAQARKPVLDVCKRAGVPVRCIHQH